MSGDRPATEDDVEKAIKSAVKELTDYINQEYGAIRKEIRDLYPDKFNKDRSGYSAE
jgi:protein associated with RNAse G/E